ncbi:MAG TPA: glycosyltransferase family 2 protein [Stellaceae bacterium]|nr:glycosyltransferase family 2 protein [Stellaceae bacterium]
MMLYALAFANHVILLLSLATLWAMGLPATWIVFQNLRHRRAALATEVRLLGMPLPPDAELPHVLVQIPSFNEGKLVRGVCDAVAGFDWPRDRLHVQLLDDSTDGSLLAASEAVSAMRERGVDAVLLHRDDRTGYKAGALAAGLSLANHEFVAIFDADYVPSKDFLRSCMRPMLLDERLALVQARCDYLNADQNWLTKIQQRILDAHFGIEQPTRSWTNQVLPFNGTCGIWRRAAIDDAGGWQSDTLAEDLDLSYRVQLRGWRALFLVTVAVPGELPATFSTWRTQQYRWVKGPTQVARKLLPMVWRSGISFSCKLLSTLQFFGSAFGPMLGIAVATGAIDLAWGVGLSSLPATLLCLAILQALAATSAMLLLGQKTVRGASLWAEIAWVPAVSAVFNWLALANLLGVLEAMVGRSSAFVRTPKAARAGEGSFGSDTSIDTAASLSNHRAPVRDSRV